LNVLSVHSIAVVLAIALSFHLHLSDMVVAADSLYSFENDTASH